MFLTKRLINGVKKHVFPMFCLVTMNTKGSICCRCPRCTYLHDWMEFLDALRKTQAIADDPYWEVPRDGAVYHCKT